LGISGSFNLEFASLGEGNYEESHDESVVGFNINESFNKGVPFSNKGT
jgi:hypothetical protein